MKILAWTLLFLWAAVALAQENSMSIASQDKVLFENANTFFSEGRYEKTLLELKSIEEKLMKNPEANKQNLGLVSYWKGIVLNRLQEYPDAIRSFDRALSLDYAPVDLHYEYGQALYASEKLDLARIQFRESLKRKFKRGICLYYIGFITKELGDNKKAYTFFKSISKLEPEEMKDVIQAAEMQIADIYLEQGEKRPDAFKTVESVVIPQYQKALELDPESSLAPVIKEKVIKLQRKYELVLFQLRNGRPTLLPPYFLRFSQEIGQDTNVTFAPAETTIDTAEQKSLFSKTDFLGRYTFYYRDFLSIAPEFRMNYTRYFNREPEIFRNDNYLIAPAIRTAYEHSLWNKPASILFDYDYNEARRDVNAQESLDFSSRSHAFMLGERFNYFDAGETILRLRYRMLESFLSDSDSTTTSLVFEQIMGLGSNTLLFYLSYDRTRVINELFDTDSFTFRTDFIFARVRDWFTPSVGLSLTSTDPINASDTRGRELLINPSLRISKTFKRSWRANLKYEYQKNQSEDKENFAFTKSLSSLELEYLF